MRGRTAQAAASPSPEPYAGRLKGENRLRQLARFLERNYESVSRSPRGAPHGPTGSRHDEEFCRRRIRASAREHKEGQ
jgi:hypothetical protein